MSLQWTLVTTFLYTEMAVCILLLLPFISVTRWRSLFKSRLVSSISQYANLFFAVFLIILIILLIDGARGVQRYADAAEDARTSPGAEAARHMKLFRAQRNFYISGFSMFLFIIMRRLVTLVSSQAALLADLEASQKQAASATSAAKRFMEEQENKTNEADESKKSKEVEAARSEVTGLKAELNRVSLDRDAMKQQAEAISKEYDRLLEEHSQLQEKLKKFEDEDIKKDN